MTPITDKLAEALRCCVRDLSIAAEYTKTGNPSAFLETCQAARNALAAYDAQQAVTPSGGAWVAEPITNVISAPPIRGRAYREPVATCNSAEYAERITACVNACAGMTTAEVLEFGAPGELGRCAQAWVAEDNDNA